MCKFVSQVVIAVYGTRLEDAPRSSFTSYKLRANQSKLKQGSCASTWQLNELQLGIHFWLFATCPFMLGGALGF